MTIAAPTAALEAATLPVGDEERFAGWGSWR